MTHVVIGTAGHIDHGKSTLVQALTGTDPDRLQEEKARGITIDLGFAHTIEGDVSLSFVDVPGHERFVRHMLAGAGGVDVVLLHVAADESVMPQTREHFEICRLLQVPAGAVVLTKADLVDPDTIDVVRLEVQELVAGSFLEHAPIVAVSARTGDGLPDLRRLLVELAAARSPRATEGPPRLPIDRVFSLRGFGTVVTGTLGMGRIAVDEELLLQPSGRRVRVRGLQVHGRACGAAVAGQRVAVNLPQVEVDEIARGETLTVQDAVMVTRRADVQLELLPTARGLQHGARVRFHQGTRETVARVALLEPGRLEPGATGFARLHLELPTALRRGDRFILRASAPVRTIGGGWVLDPAPPRRGVRTRGAAARFAALAQTGAQAGALEQMVGEAGLAGVRIAHLGARAGLLPSVEAALLASLGREGRVVRLDGCVIQASLLETTAERVLEIVSAYHEAHPLEEGMPREELRASACGPAPPGVLDHLLDSLVAAGRVTARDRVALAGRALSLTDEECRARDAMIAALEQAGLTPPEAGTLAGRLGVPAETASRIGTLLVRQEVLVRVGDLLFHEAPLRRLKDDLRRVKASGEADSIDVATFKDRYGLTRKHAIPLLEFLDRERVTRRMGEKRVIR